MWNKSPTIGTSIPTPVINMVVSWNKGTSKSSMFIRSSLFLTIQLLGTTTMVDGQAKSESPVENGGKHPTIYRVPNQWFWVPNQWFSSILTMKVPIRAAAPALAASVACRCRRPRSPPRTSPRPVAGPLRGSWGVWGCPPTDPLDPWGYPVDHGDLAMLYKLPK